MLRIKNALAQRLMMKEGLGVTVFDLANFSRVVNISTIQKKCHQA